MRSLDFTACTRECSTHCWRKLTKEEQEWLKNNPNRMAYADFDDCISYRPTENLEKNMLKVGQIYKQKNNEIFVVTQILDGDVFIIYNDGHNVSYPIDIDKHTFICDKLIASYNTWQQAVNSPEFRGEK